MNKKIAVKGHEDSLLIASVSRGLHLDPCIMGEDIMGVLCHFKQAEISGTQPAIQMDEKTYLACPVACKCETSSTFLLEYHKKHNAAPGNLANSQRCFFNGKPSGTREAAHYIEPFTQTHADVCKNICGGVCN